MTNKEKNMLKSRFQQRWGQAICIQQWAKQGKTAGPKKKLKNLQVSLADICTLSGTRWKRL